MDFLTSTLSVLSVLSVLNVCWGCSEPEGHRVKTFLERAQEARTIIIGTFTSGVYVTYVTYVTWETEPHVSHM